MEKRTARSRAGYGTSGQGAHMGTRFLGERPAEGPGREKVATGPCYVFSVNLLLRKDVILALGPFRLL